jgi:transposase
MAEQIAARTEYSCTRSAIGKSIAAEYTWRNRVPRGALERLERHNAKALRAVLRGLGVSNGPWLPDTFGWLNRYRRLSKDYETRPASSEALTKVAMINLMVQRVAAHRSHV